MNAMPELNLRANTKVEKVVQWFIANPDELLFASDIRAKFDLSPSGVHSLTHKPMQAGLIKRVRVPHRHGIRYAYMAGDAA